MFEMVFGQDAITTREYTVEITSETTEINIMELVSESEGAYSLEVVKYQVTDYPENPYCSIKLDSNLGESESIAYNSDETSIQFYDMDDDGAVDRIRLNVEVGGLVVNSQSPNLNIDNYDDPDDLYYANPCNNHSGNLTIRVTGRFSDTDVGLQGDMNDDNDLDVLDVVMLVDVIINGGVGDVGDLINIVRG
jgi:hypothetical protein